MLWSVACLAPLLRNVPNKQGTPYQKTLNFGTYGQVA